MKEQTSEIKIQKICDVIRKETLDPAKQQAKEIVENARLEAEEIVKKAKKENEQIISDAKKQIAKEKKIFDSAMSLATRQAFEELKQKIENELFNKNLKELVTKNTTDPKIIAGLITAIIKTIEEKGLDVDISAYIPKLVDANKITTFLSKEILNKLKEKELVLKDFEGGVKIKLHEMQITIDISDSALKDLIAAYIRQDFRQKIFNV